MGKVKIAKKDTFVDMTAMSDVTVLLLTFFMLTATFLPLEPVQVLTPASVSETKIPENNVLTILLDRNGKVFVNMDNKKEELAVLNLMGQDYGITFSEEQKRAFIDQTHIGVPMDRMTGFLNLPDGYRNDEIKKYGIPTDSTNNQLAMWVKHAREVNDASNEDLEKDKQRILAIAIKADNSTPYPYVDNVMKILVKIKENRYSLVTTLKGMPAGL